MSPIPDRRMPRRRAPNPPRRFAVRGVLVALCCAALLGGCASVGGRPGGAPAQASRDPAVGQALAQAAELARAGALHDQHELARALVGVGGDAFAQRAPRAVEHGLEQLGQLARERGRAPGA
ncbi:hypothetical protein, partial [Vulcaniibacterium tengchongense]|uniref:hypothetical protein n=1 Tax=Vulcaniibacterium tengchongense TaxID=1273429 RepID=UPI0018F56065